MVFLTKMLNDALPKELRMPYVWVLPPHALGDTYLTLCLARPFMLRHPDTPLTVVVPAAHMRVFELFPEFVERACVLSNLTVETCRQMASGASIEPGVPFVAHPEYLADAILMRLIGHNGFRHWDAWRLMLGLPVDQAFSWHAPQVAHVAAAKARFTALGLPAGRTAVLFPKSNAIDSTAVDWAGIVAQLYAQGWSVCCNLRPDEPTIAGTQPVDLPLGELCSFVEMAGWAIASRSGICDIMVPARCRKTIIYPHTLYHAMFSFAGVDSHCDECIGNVIDLIGDAGESM